MDMTMALRAHTRGGPDQLICEQAPVPVPQREEALVDYAALEAGERVLVHGGAGGVGVYAVQARAHQVHAMFFVVTPDPGELAQLAGVVDEGRLRPVISQTFPLSQAGGPSRAARSPGRRARPC